MACCGVNELARSDVARSCWDVGDRVDALDRIWIPFMPLSYKTKSRVLGICDRGSGSEEVWVRAQSSRRDVTT